MFKTIVLPIDGSPLAGRAIPFARHLARSGDARLVLVRAYLPSDDTLPLRIAHPDKSPTVREQIDRAQLRDEFQSQVDEVRAQLGDGSVEAHFRCGAAAGVILGTAREVHADVIVISTHGRSGLGRWLSGSVADQVLRQAAVPVLLLPSATTGPWADMQPGRVLVALDGSDLASRILRPAVEMATALGGAELMLVTVVEPPHGSSPTAEAQRARAMEYLSTVASDLASTAPGSITCRVLFGAAAPTLASVASEAAVQVIAMATHGRVGPARLALGSVASRTLQLASTPLLVLGPGALVAPSPSEPAEAVLP